MALSKTEEPCTCGLLAWAAETMGVPIRFDQDRNGFLLVHGADGGQDLFLRHCFFCGGKAPASGTVPPSLFENLTREERFRLVRLTQSLKTVMDTLAALGEPDQDLEAGMIVTGREGEDKREMTRYYRILRYYHLSETATVEVTVYPQGEVSFAFSGQRVGKKDAPRDA